MCSPPCATDCSRSNLPCCWPITTSKTRRPSRLGWKSADQTWSSSNLCFFGGMCIFNLELLAHSRTHTRTHACIYVYMHTFVCIDQWNLRQINQLVVDCNPWNATSHSWGDDPFPNQLNNPIGQLKGRDSLYIPLHPTKPCWFMGCIMLNSLISHCEKMTTAS